MLAVVVAVALALSGVLDRAAASALDRALTRGFATFAVARTLNGVVSMAQDADISVSPAGVGLTVSPGELLDPINDLLEQFSTLAFTALMALGVQKLALQATAGVVANALLVAVALAWWAIGRWSSQDMPRRAARRALAVALLLRFVVPGFALATEAVDRGLLSPTFEAAKAQLQLTTDAAQAEALPPPKTPEASSLGERLSRWWSDARDTLDVRDRISRLGDIAGRAAEPLVTLAVVFLLQAIVLPLAFLALATQSLRMLLVRLA